jgi:16S rRNA (cytosine1402-N4)-methyltransferase
VDVILLDLGVSSMQMDTPERGFAFKHDAPLDMRFDPQSTRPTAAELLHSSSENELAVLFYRYGEEKHSRRIAQRIVKQRSEHPIETTGQLATLVEEATPRRKKGQSHPATRVFQALRIAVNDELQVVEQAIPMAIDLLNPGGRLAVISFHSLEDRIVKQHFKDASTEIVAPPGMGSVEEKQAIVRLVNRKPIAPGEDEMANNPRSRSSKLRVVEKI